MILLIDNYDSFSYNLYQLIGSVEPDIKVIRNDAHTIEEIKAMKPEAIILSPGPGKPEECGGLYRGHQVLHPASCRSSACVWDIRRSVRHSAVRFLMQRS